MDIATVIEEKRRESPTLEYKHKRANAEAIVKELVSFVNSDGGTVILGVQEEEDEIVGLQHIPNTGTREESIQNHIADNVDPRIRVSFEYPVVDEKQLIAISVEPDGYLHSHTRNGRPVYPVRQGTRLVYLNALELLQKLRDLSRVNISSEDLEVPSSVNNGDYDFSWAENWVGGVARLGSVDEFSTRSPPAYSAPDNRAVIEVGDYTMVVPGKVGLEPSRLDTLTFHVNSRLTIDSESEVRSFIADVGEQLGARPDHDLYYAIRHGSRALVGRQPDNLLQDSERISEITDRLTPGSGDISDARPSVVATLPTSYGLAWLEFEWRNQAIRPGHVYFGLVSENIPLDTSPISTLLSDFGGSTNVFEQNSRIQHLNFNLDHILEGTEPVHLKSDIDDTYTEIVADNPFYDTPGAVKSAFEGDIPNHFCEALATVNRFPMDVAGGWIESDEQFRFTDLEVMLLTGPQLPTYVLDPMCFAIDEGGLSLPGTEQ